MIYIIDTDQQADQEERQERIKSAVDLLIKFCMVNSYDKQISFDIHRLVQEVTKSKLKESLEEESVLNDALQSISNVNVNVRRANAILVFSFALPYPDLVKEFSSFSLTILENILFFTQQNNLEIKL